MRLLSRYVLAQWMRIFLLTALGLPIVSVLTQVTDNLRRLLDRQLSPGTIALSYVFSLPQNIAITAENLTGPKSPISSPRARITATDVLTRRYASPSVSPCARDGAGAASRSASTSVGARRPLPLITIPPA